jgi:hypothetical protein
LVCELDRFTGRISGFVAVQHKGSIVDVYRARAIPFWFNVGARIDDGKRAVQICTWSLGRRRLIRTLTEAGFTVHLYRTWLFRGSYFPEHGW